MKTPVNQSKSPKDQSTKAYVYSEIHQNRLEVGVVIPRDALDALGDGGLERLIKGFTAELLQATLSIVTDDEGKVC